MKGYFIEVFILGLVLATIVYSWIWFNIEGMM